MIELTRDDLVAIRNALGERYPIDERDHAIYRAGLAAGITTLRERIAALEAERDQWRDQDSRELKEWQAMAERMEAERDAMRHLALWLRSHTSCENYHHDKRERHSGLECPVEARIDAELNWSKP